MSVNSGETSILRLRRRHEFVAARKGMRHDMCTFRLQALRRRDNAAGVHDAARFGFTVTGKTGTAVERNRIRRRLKNAVRLTAGDKTLPGHDYVLIGKRAALSAEFDEICRQLEQALDAMSRKTARSRPEPMNY